MQAIGQEVKPQVTPIGGDVSALVNQTEAHPEPSAKTSQNTQQTEQRAPIAGRGTRMGLDPAPTAKDFAKALPTIASVAAVPLTEGMSLLPAALTMGAASGVGHGAEGLIEGQSPSEAGLSALGHGAADTALGTVFGLGGKALDAIAPTLKGAALRVTAPLARKFGTPSEIGETALKYAIHPTEEGAAKAGLKIGSLKAQKTALLNRVDQANVVPNPNLIALRVGQRVQPDVEAEAAAGLLPENSVADRIDRFVSGQRNAPTSARVLEAAKGKLDDAATAAYKAQQMGRRLDAADKTAQYLARESGATQQALSQPFVKPGELDYNALNKEIMALKGAQLAASGRAQIPASGLDDLAAAYGVAAGDPAFAAMRVARAPVARSYLAQGMYNAAPSFKPPSTMPTIEALKALWADLIAGKKE